MTVIDSDDRTDFTDEERDAGFTALDFAAEAGATIKERIAIAQAIQPASMRPENGEDLALAARDYQEARAHLAHSGQILAREVANAVDAGMSVAEAARIAGVERHTVYSWLFKAQR